MLCTNCKSEQDAPAYLWKEVKYEDGWKTVCPVCGLWAYKQGRETKSAQFGWRIA